MITSATHIYELATVNKYLYPCVNIQLCPSVCTCVCVRVHAIINRNMYQVAITVQVSTAAGSSLEQLIPR